MARSSSFKTRPESGEPAAARRAGSRAMTTLDFSVHSQRRYQSFKLGQRLDAPEATYAIDAPIPWVDHDDEHGIEIHPDMVNDCVFSDLVTCRANFVDKHQATPSTHSYRQGLLQLLVPLHAEELIGLEIH